MSDALQSCTTRLEPAVRVPRVGRFRFAVARRSIRTADVIDPRIDQLRHIPALAALSGRNARTLAGATTEVQRSEGTIVVRAGSNAHEALLIVEGTVALVRCDCVVGRAQVGDLLGVAALLAHEAHDSMYLAETDVRLLVVEPRRLAALRDIAAFDLLVLDSLRRFPYISPRADRVGAAVRAALNDATEVDPNAASAPDLGLIALDREGPAAAPVR